MIFIKMLFIIQIDDFHKKLILSFAYYTTDNDCHVTKYEYQENFSRDSFLVGKYDVPIFIRTPLDTLS